MVSKHDPLDFPILPGGCLKCLLVGVVHVVVDGVDAGGGAGVAAGGAPGRGATLGGRVGDAVAAGAAALEGVVQAEPVAALVDDGEALVVVGQGAAGHGAREDGAAVQDEVAVARGDVGGEVAVAQVVHAGDEVEVEVGVGSLAQGRLHGDLARVRGPGGVDGPVGSSRGEGDAVRGVGRVQGGQLGSNGGRLW